MRLLSAPYLVCLSLIIWLVFALSIPASYLYKGTGYFAFGLLALYVSLFLAGYASIGKGRYQHLRSYGVKKLKQVTGLLFILGLAGVLVKLYSGLFVTRIFASANIAAKREELFAGEFNSGAFGVVGAILFPFGVICMLIVLYNIKHFRRRFVIPAVLFGLYPFVETYFLGGRTVIVLLGTTLLIVLYLSYLKNSRLPTTRISFLGYKLLSLPRILLKKRTLIGLGLLAFVFVSYSVKVISSRLELFQYKDTLEVWEGYHEVSIDEEFKQKVDQLPSSGKYFEIGVYSLKHYFAHGVFEYVRLVNHLEHSTGYYYGGYEFFVFFKFFKFFGIPMSSFAELNKISYKPAVYTTFWGPFYIDFGVWGLIVAFLWGRYVRRVYLKAVQGISVYVALYSFLAVIMLASFFLNFITGTPSYYLFGFFVSVLIFKVWPEDLRLVLKSG